MKGLLIFEERHVLWVVILIALLARVLFIASVEFPFFDEIPHRTSAYSYVERGFYGVDLWYHQNFRNILYYFSMTLFGDNPIGWRLPWVMIGTLSVYLIYMLTLNIFSSRTTAVIAAFLLAIDPLHIVQNRVNPDETMTVLTFLGSLLFVLRYREGMKPYNLIISGAFLGLGLSVKWYTALTMVAVLMVGISSVFRKELKAIEKAGNLMFVFCALIVIPATIYLLTYYPWFGGGHPFEEFIELQRDKYIYLQSMKVSDFKSMHLLKTPGVFTWFVVPVFTGFKEQFPNSIIIIPYATNPLTWLLVLPSTGYAIYRLISERSFPLMIAVGIFLFHYLPLFLVRRPLFLHSALSVLPAAFIIVAYFLNEVSREERRRHMFILFICANLVLFLLLLPLLTIYPVSPEFYEKNLMWLEPFWVMQDS